MQDQTGRTRAVDPLDPRSAVHRFADSAATLQGWHDGGQAEIQVRLFAGLSWLRSRRLDAQTVTRLARRTSPSHTCAAGATAPALTGPRLESA